MKTKTKHEMTTKTAYIPTVEILEIIYDDIL